MSHKVCSKYYKAPELIVQFEFYNYSIDIWAIGVLLASIVFQKHPFFLGENLFDQLIQITNLLGSDQFLKFHLKYGLNLPDKPSFKGSFRRSFDDFKNERNSFLVDDEVVDLIKLMLRFDPEERIHAKDALKHKYFCN